MMKNFPLFSIILILFLIVVNLLRFYRIEAIPEGYHVDEYAAAVNLQCLGKEGVNAFGHKDYVFLQQGFGTPKPPVYTYPALVWTKIFGYTVPALRAFSTLIIVIGIIGLFFLGRLLGGFNVGLWSAVAASVSPWSWALGRLGWESFFAPVVVIWGLFFFFKRRSLWDDLLAGLFFCCAAYLYPPARIFVPLFLGALICFEVFIRQQKHSWWVFGAAFTIPSIFLIHAQLTGQLNYRINEVAIWNTDYLSTLKGPNQNMKLAGAFLDNYLKHLDPKFLFMTGDPDLKHSTQKAGLLSILDMTAWLMLGLSLLAMKATVFAKSNVWKDHGKWLVLCWVGFFISIVPAGLTFLNVPNALRICLGWPFICLMTGFAVAWICQRHFLLSFGLTVLVIISTSVYLNDYFKNYSQRSKFMFTYWIKNDAEQNKTPKEWFVFLLKYYIHDYHERYYLMNHLGQSCSESYQIWKNTLNLACKTNPQGQRCREIP